MMSKFVKNSSKWMALAIVATLCLATAGMNFFAAESGETQTILTRENLVLNYQQMDSLNTSFSDEVRYDIPCVQGTLPGSYSSSADVDWEFEVQNDYVTAVKNQNPYGTCWAHTAISVAETSYIINMGATNSAINADTIDFNEYHLVHYNYSTPADPLGLLGGDYNYIPSEDFLNQGGNCELVMYNFANWIGASDSTDFTVDDVQGDNSDAMGYEDAAHLQNGYILTMPDMTTTTYQADMDVVKQMIMEYGSIAISYYSGTAGGDEFSGYYYYPSESGTNHAVTVVGWDDSIPASSFETQPAGNGAWLVKNSWSTYGDFGGYFWLSYYDMSIADNAYVYDFVSADNYDNNYQYDGTVSGMYRGYMDQTCQANAFVADSAETLEAVGFYTLAVNTEYELRIYKNLAADALPETGDLVYTSTGTETYAGFHTVQLSEAIELVKGERYAVVITIYNEGDYAYVPIDQTYSYGWIEFYSFAKAGESYFGYSVDNIYDLNEDNTTYAEGVNVRIKAFTNEVETEIETALNGVHQDADGNWYYYVDGVVDTTYTGLSTNDYGTWYVVYGQVDFSKSGVLQIGGQWCYLTQGKLQTSYTGFGTNDYGTWYVENGQIDFATTGTVTVGDNEYLVIGSKLRDDFTGFTDETYNRVYVAKGRVYRNLNGVLQLSGVWAYVINGEWQADYTGFATNDYGTWYINEGKVDFSGNGLVEVNGDTCYMVSGKFQSTYVGFVSNDEGTWYVSQGKADYTKTDVFKVGTDWYYVIEGKWQSDFTGVADNAYGTWYIKDGKVDFTYSGTITVNEVTYTIQDGKVVSTQ